MKSVWKKTKSVFRKLYGGRWYKRVAMWVLTLFIMFFLFLGAVDLNLFGLFGASPGFSDIKQAESFNSEASEIYSADSVLIGRYFSENRSAVTYEEISPILIRTLVDTEDERFYEHWGIDIKGLFSAAKDMAQGHARGASTITQQLAKNLFVRTKKSSTGMLGNNILVKKMKEWIIATKLEIALTKEDILTMYLNTVDFGCNSFGIKTAARTYFGTTPDKLNYEQSATLVGLLKATSLYNPRTNPKNSLERRNIVLKQVYEKGHILVHGKPATKAQYDSIKAIPVMVVEHRNESSNDGIAPYFRRAITDYINMLCDRGLIEGYDKNNHLDLYAEGLRIYTTLDTKMQAYAEEAAHRQMQQIQDRFNNHWRGMNPWRDEHGKEIPDFLENLAKKTEYYSYFEKKYEGNQDSIFYHLQNDKHLVTLYSYEGTREDSISVMDSIRYMVSFMHCGLVAIEPDTRHVKAWVGDLDFNSWQYDKVTAMRQPGSTFKLFVYAEAMKQGLTPNTTRPDRYKAYPDTVDGKPTIWAPHNADGHFSNANISLKTAFAMSINSIAVGLGYECGIEKIAKTAKDMGIDSPLEAKPSLSLGSSDVNLLELTNAYCTPINEGRYNMPILVTRIVDRHGKVIYEARKQERQALPYKAAYLMQKMLQAGMSGTSSRLRSFVSTVYNLTEWGGKTGTSNNHSDAWFIGVTPKLVFGSWVGGEYRSIHFRTGELGQGNKTALPICGDFMNLVLKDEQFKKYRVKFNAPKESIEDKSYSGGIQRVAGHTLDAEGSIIEPTSPEENGGAEEGETPTTPDTPATTE